MSELFGEPIYTYSRAQALEDGVLIDVSKLADEAGWKLPVAVTSALMADITPLPEVASKHGCDKDGRLWDLLWMGANAARRSGGTEIRYQLIMPLRKGDRLDSLYTVKAVCGPGDNMEPVITLMCPDED